MIAKRAAWHFTGRQNRPAASAMAAPCNDNRARGRSRSQRMLRHALVCHWRLQPLTGALESVWQADEIMKEVAGPDGAAADVDSAPSRLIACTRRQLFSLVTDVVGVLPAVA